MKVRPKPTLLLAFQNVQKIPKITQSKMFYFLYNYFTLQHIIFCVI